MKIVTIIADTKRSTSGDKLKYMPDIVTGRSSSVSHMNRKQYDCRHCCLLVLSKKIQFMKAENIVLAMKNSVRQPKYIAKSQYGDMVHRARL